MVGSSRLVSGDLRLIIAGTWDVYWAIVVPDARLREGSRTRTVLLQPGITIFIPGTSTGTEGYSMVWPPGFGTGCKKIGFFLQKNLDFSKKCIIFVVRNGDNPETITN